MTIAAILHGRGEVFTLTAGMNVREATVLLHDRHIGAAPVMADGVVIGILSERDIVRQLAMLGADATATLVGQAMTAPAITIGPSESAIGALSLMTQRRIRHLPVVDDGTLIGFVSIGDLVKYRIERIEADAAAMRAYIQAT